MIKALTLHRPHSQLVALRRKRFETRGWRTHYRGPLAITASLSDGWMHLCGQEPFTSALLGCTELPSGCVVAICDLTAVIPTVPERSSGLFGETRVFTEEERAFGDFSPGRWAWQLENVLALEVPIPVRGKQGLWDWDERELWANAENQQQLMKHKSKFPLPALYRQGDVAIEQITQLPDGLTKQAPEGGRIILAHGEVTGHAHGFDAATADKFVDASGAEFFAIRGVKIHNRLPLVRVWNSQVMALHPKYGNVEFAAASVRVVGKTVFVDGEFGLLKHDEHSTQAIPAGFYRGASGGVVRQREYSPEEIRNVAD